MPFQLSAVSEAVAALWAAEALFSLLVPVLDVLLQRAVTLVATRAVRAGEQLRERIRSSWVIKTQEESVVTTLSPSLSTYYVESEGGGWEERVKNTW